VVINKLHKKKQLSSHYLIFKSIDSQIIFNNLIQSFILIIYLKMISNRKSSFNYLNLADFLLKIRSNVRIFICYNVFQKVKTTFNMLKEQLYEVCSYTVILSEYKQHVFDDTAYY